MKPAGGPVELKKTVSFELVPGPRACCIWTKVPGLDGIGPPGTLRGLPNECYRQRSPTTPSGGTGHRISAGNGQFELVKAW